MKRHFFYCFFVILCKYQNLLSMIYSKFSITKLTFGLKISVLISFFCLCFAFTSVCLFLCSLLDLTTKQQIISQILLQNLLLFILPSLLTVFLISKRPFTYLWLNNFGSIRYYIFALIVYIVSLPAMNWLVEWNNSIHLPSSLQTLETVLRALENSAQEITNYILQNTTIGELSIMVLLVGVLTGVGEEFFFRGTLQSILCRKPMNYHIAIFISAFIFSAFHFQFFGFIPRLLMGMFFGYLLLWGKSLWIPIFAHALNNSFYIINEYYTNATHQSQNFSSTIGTSVNMQWIAAISLIATIVLLIFHKRICKE